MAEQKKKNKNRAQSTEKRQRLSECTCSAWQTYRLTWSNRHSELNTTHHISRISKDYLCVHLYCLTERPNVCACVNVYLYGSTVLCYLAKRTMRTGTTESAQLHIIKELTNCWAAFLWVLFTSSSSSSFACSWVQLSLCIDTGWTKGDERTRGRYIFKVKAFKIYTRSHMCI